MKPGIGGKRTAVRGIVGIWVALVSFDVVVNIGFGLASNDGGFFQGGISGVIEIKVKVNFNISRTSSIIVMLKSSVFNTNFTL